MSEADNQKKLQTAFSLHQAGDLNKAAHAYREILKSDPNNFQALHYLGVVEAYFGNTEQAKSLIARSVSLQPENIQYLENYSAVLFQTGDYKTALQICQQGLLLASANCALLYVSAISLFKLKRLQESLTHFDRLLLIQPNHVAAINERGSLLAEMKEYDAALASIEKALTFNPNYAEAYLNKGNLCGLLKHYEVAIAAYDKAIALRPDFADAWLGRGSVLRQHKQLDDALTAYDKALAIKPGIAAAWVGRGNVLFDIGRYTDALTAYDKALAIEPDLASAWLGRGNVFLELKRPNDALTAHDKALDLEPDSASAWLGRGNVFFDLKRYDEAIVAYDKALTFNSALAEAWLGRGNIFTNLNSYDEAIGAYNEALALKPDLAAAWLGRGNIFAGLKQHDEALSAYGRALTLIPDLAEAWLGRGNVHYELTHFDEAVKAFDIALELKADIAEGMRLDAKLHLCNWTNFYAESQHLASSVRSGIAAAQPFSFLSIASSPFDQFQCAKLWTATKHPLNRRALWTRERHRHDRVCIAYVSSDLRPHPMSHVVAGLFENHDREKYRVVGISLQPEDRSEVGQRLKRALETFVDTSGMPDQKVAQLICELEVDIAIDLTGHTRNSRTNIFAQRAAPVQVSYMGFPGTMGAEYIDYIIADRVVVPAESASLFSEKIVWMPNTYWTADQKLAIGQAVQSRTEAGLPNAGFVFCCFNNNYKILPNVFDSWMRILGRVKGSVLWLLEDNALAAANLRKEAAARGIDANRLVFAKRMPVADHLARHQLADLFLDTLPYNAHTTASDALWAGLPLLTQIGETFAGRVAASVLNAIGLPELVTSTQQEYEDRAIDLASNPENLAAIKQKLSQNRLTKPLFDTQLFTRQIEAAYTAMYERDQAGLPPDHIYVEH
jgi:protein O-GlcNAc transferase